MIERTELHETVTHAVVLVDVQVGGIGDIMKIARAQRPSVPSELELGAIPPGAGAMATPVLTAMANIRRSQRGGRHLMGDHFWTSSSQNKRLPAANTPALSAGFSHVTRRTAYSCACRRRRRGGAVRARRMACVCPEPRTDEVGQGGPAAAKRAALVPANPANAMLRLRGRRRSLGRVVRRRYTLASAQRQGPQGRWEIVRELSPLAHTRADHARAGRLGSRQAEAERESN
ncbi:hypothetical protein T492DRAFT_833748 [Pavlovales sp. CCMP2436]|nr:hypothetical protein T492DRAFT_833748 [Pavlovales sp. CCMP2436]